MDSEWDVRRTIGPRLDHLILVERCNHDLEGRGKASWAVRNLHRSDTPSHSQTLPD